MGRLGLLSFALVASLLVCIGCNEIIGAGRYDVADGATSVDAESRDSSTDTDTGPPDFDAGECDPADQQTYYLDGDSDTYGLDGTTVQACSLPDGYSAMGGDCDDGVDTAYPGASEICDGVDSDCDGTIDEGVIGPVGPAFEIIPSTSAGPSTVTAYAGGYLVVAGSVGIWLDEAAMPSSTLFAHQGSTVWASGDQVDAVVYEDTSPARAVIGFFDESSAWLTVRAFSANEATTALSSITVLRPPTDPPFAEAYQIDLVRVGDHVLVFAPFTGGDDDSLLRVGAVDPVTWTQVGSFDETFINSYYGTLPVASTPPSAIVSFTVVSGLAIEGELHWLSALATGPSIDTRVVAAPGTSSRIYVPSAPVGIPDLSNTLMVVEDSSTLCLHPVTLPATGDAVVLGSCPGAITWGPREMHVRQGVVSVLTTTGSFLEESLAPGTSGTPSVSLGITGSSLSMAVHEGRGVVIYRARTQELMALPLGCSPP